MKIRISEIPEEGLEIDEEVSLKIDSGTAPGRISLKVEKRGAEVFVQGNLDARLEMVCSRCLKEFMKTVSVPVDSVYHPMEELTDESHELGPEELETGFYKNDELDVDQLASEQLLLNLPMKALCNEGCKGICPSCGKDLNQETCKCSAGQKSNSGLKKLFEGKE